MRRRPGTDIGPPGVRPKYSGYYHAAFVLDPDGNNVEAVFNTPAELRRRAVMLDVTVPSLGACILAEDP